MIFEAIFMHQSNGSCFLISLSLCLPRKHLKLKYVLAWISGLEFELIFDISPHSLMAKLNICRSPRRENVSSFTSKTFPYSIFTPCKCLGGIYEMLHSKSNAAIFVSYPRCALALSSFTIWMLNCVYLSHRPKLENCCVKASKQGAK